MKLLERLRAIAASRTISLTPEGRRCLLALVERDIASGTAGRFEYQLRRLLR